MGNICCMEQSAPSRNLAPPVPHSQRPSIPVNKFKREEQYRFQQQKKLLKDFSYAVHILKQNSNTYQPAKFKGMYTHDPIAQDGTSQYFKATLVTEQDKYFPCVVKRTPKQLNMSPQQKRSLMIQYLLTSHHHSNFIVRNLNYYQDENYLFIFFNLDNYCHLNAYFNNISQPDICNYFHMNLQVNIRFVIAGIIEGISYLHSLNIVYRGINMENIVIKQDGYPCLTNLSKLHPNKYYWYQANGHPYISPQELRGAQIGFAADLWSLGVLTYTMCSGSTPNFSQFVQNQFHPVGISPDLADLVNRLLVFNPSVRIGASNINQIKFHPFFRGFNWYNYSNRSIPSPLAQQYSHVQYNTQQRTYNQSNYNDNNYGIGFGFMATMLFVDIAALYLIAESFDSTSNFANEAFPTGQQYAFNEQEIQPEQPNAVDDFGGGDYD